MYTTEEYIQYIVTITDIGIEDIVAVTVNKVYKAVHKVKDTHLPSYFLSSTSRNILCLALSNASSRIFLKARILIISHSIPSLTFTYRISLTQILNTHVDSELITCVQLFGTHSYSHTMLPHVLYHVRISDTP